MIRLLAILVLGLLPGFAVAAEDPTTTPDAAAAGGFEEGREFLRVLPAQATDATPGEVEVLEFFWYGCPHCFAAEEHIDTWLETKPENVVFRRVPATLNRGWVLMARAHYVAEQLGVLDVMHDALFAAFHTERRALADEDALAAYFLEKAGVEDVAFRAAFDSPRVASQVRRADVLARRYAISGVPTMTVNGKFLTDPARANGYAAMVVVADMLARRELQQVAE